MNELDQIEEGKKYAQVVSSQIEAEKGEAIAYPRPSVLKGRRKIYTNYISQSQVKPNMAGYAILNDENIVDAVNLALKIHYDNAYEIRYLLDMYKGDQPILYRNKDVRPDVNNKIVFNYANSFTRDIVGYTFGKPMQYVARRTDDQADGENGIKDEVRLLNDYSEMNNKSTSDQKKATLSSICGVAYRGVFPTDADDNEIESGMKAPYYYLDLDSDKTFVAYSSQFMNEPVFAVTFTSSYGVNDDSFVLFYVYTVDKVYAYKVPLVGSALMYSDANSYVGAMLHNEYLVEGFPQDNPIKKIPIIECENNQFRMGHWETATTLMDAINKTGSDSVNDVEQTVNAILVAVNAEFTKEQMDNVKENKYAEIKSYQNMPADLKYITCAIDGSSTEQLRQYLEDCLRAIVGIPDRKTRGGGGGDTGDAVKLRDGWADMEVVARTTETFNKKSEKEELKVILTILKNLKKDFKTSMINVDIKYPRNKTDNLNSKVTAYSAMLSTNTIAPDDALDIVDITSDNAEVVRRGTDYWKKQKEENFEENLKQLKAQSELQGANSATQEGGNVNAKSNNKQSVDRTTDSKSRTDDK